MRYKKHHRHHHYHQSSKRFFIFKKKSTGAGFGWWKRYPLSPYTPLSPKLEDFALGCSYFAYLEVKKGCVGQAVYTMTVFL